MCNKAFACYRIWHLKSPWTIFNLSRKKGKNCVAEELNMVPSSKYMKNSKQKLKKLRVGNVLMVNLNQILPNFFLPPSNLFTAAERITDSCLPFRKTTLSVEKNNHFWKYISLGYFPRQTNSFLRTLFKHEDRNPILTWWNTAEACPWILTVMRSPQAPREPEKSCNNFYRDSWLLNITSANDEV